MPGCWERWVCGLNFGSPTNQRDYLFAVIDTLNTDFSYTQRVNNEITRAKVIVQNTKRFEAEGLALKAEAEIKKLFGEQFKGKEKLIEPNVKALHMGRDYALKNLPCPIGLRVRRSTAIGDRVFLEGNNASALGAVYGGATVCAWYPITPSSSGAAIAAEASRAAAVNRAVRNWRMFVFLRWGGSDQL